MTASHSTQAAKRPWLRRIAKLLMLAQVLYPIAGIAPASAQALTPSTNAPAGQRPIIDAAQNGVPIVHIAPPSVGGVSRNQFQQFNVGSNGLILNNSSANVQTQLGGWISGNMQLGPTPARIILNEVVSSSTGNSASQLKGFIEVAGQRADIVIANPNGVSCDGCGFLNTNGRATLTTGAPQFGAQGELTGFNVGQGQINIGSGGLNATNLEQLDLIARGLVIEGEVWAKNLQVVAGANQVLYGTLNATPQAGTGAAPSFAIDIKELGGMYANQIYMVATEQGLGVNSTGRIAALQGNLSLSANGDLSLKDSYAKQNLQLASGGNTTLSGITQSEGSAQVRSADTLTQQGVFVSAGQLDVAVAGLTNTGTLYSAGALNIAATQVNDINGRLLAAGNLNIAAQGIALSGTQLSTDKSLTLTASVGDVSLTNAQIYAAGEIAANASGTVANSGGFVQSGGSIAVQAGSVANRNGTVLANGALRLTADEAIDNNGGKLMGSTAVDLIAGSLVNDASSTSQALIASDQGTRITATGSAGISNRGGVLSGKTELVVASSGQTLNNAGGTLVSDNALRIVSGDLDNTGGQIVSRALQDTSAALSISTANIDNRQGLIDAGAALQLGSSGAVRNQLGTIQAGTNASAAANQGGLNLQSASLDNTAGQLLSRDALALATGKLSNDVSNGSRGVIASTAATTTLQSAALSNQGGLISSVTGTDVNSQVLNNTGGEITSAAGLTLNANGQALNNSAGRITAQGVLDIRVGALINDAAALIAGNRTLSIQATGLSNRGSSIGSAGDASLALGAGALDNSAGNIASATQLTLSAGAVNNQAGRIVANQRVTASVNGLDNTSGVVSAADAVSIDSAGAVVNLGGQLSSNGALRIAGSGLDNTRGSVSASATELRLGTGTLLNNQGQILGTHSLAMQSGAIGNAGGVLATGSALTIDTAGQDFSNAGGTLQVGGALRITTARLDNSAGRIVADSDLTLQSASLNNTGGEISSAAAQRIDTNGQSLDNTAGRIAAATSLTLDSGAVTNRGGRLVSDGTLAVAGTSLDNAQGVVSASATDLRLGTGTLSNDQGQLIGVQSLGLQSGAIANVGGTISTNAALTLNTGGQTLANTGGTIQAGAALGITAGTLDNRGGKLVSSAAVRIDSQALVNDGGRIVAEGALTLRSVDLANGNAALISAATDLDIAATRLDTSAGTLQAGQDLRLTASASLTNHNGTVTAGRDLAVQAGSLNNDAGSLTSNGNLDLRAGAVSNRAGQIAALGSATVALTALDNSAGRIVANQALTLGTQGGLVNNDGGVIASAQTVALDVGQLSNQAGLINGATGARIDSQSLNNRGGELSSAAALTIDTQGQSLDNTAGRISSQGALDLRAGVIRNEAGPTQAASIASNTTLSIQASGLSNRASSISSVGAGSIDLGSSTLDNNAGSIASGSALSLKAGALSNLAGQIVASQSVTATLASLDNTGGLISAANVVSLTSAGSVDNSRGQLTSNGTVSVAGTGLNNTQGLISAQGADIRLGTGAFNNDRGSLVGVQSLALQSGAITNTRGSIATGAALTLDTAGQDLDNTNGTVQTGGALGLTTGRLTNAGGTQSSASAASIASQHLDNRGGRIVANGNLGVQSTNLDNDAGVLTSNATLSLSSGVTSNRGGQLSALGSATVNVSSLDTSAGRIVSNQVLTLNTQGGALVNDAGVISSTQSLALDAGTLSNQGGLIGSVAGSRINSQTLNNSGGEVSSAAAQSIDTHGQSLTNTGGRITAQGVLDLQAGAIVNDASSAGQAALIAGNSTLSLRATSLSNLGSSIASVGDGSVALGAGALDNTGGTLSSAGNLSLDAGAAINTATAGSGGVVSAQGTLQATLASLDNTQGQLVAGGASTLVTAGSLINEQGRIATNADLSLTAASISNRAGQIGAAQAASLSVSASGTLNNDAGAIQADALSLHSGALSNVAGLIASNTTLALNTGGRGLNNNGGTIQAIGSAEVVAGQTSNSSGRVLAGQVLDVTTLALNNTVGEIASGGRASITTQGQSLVNDAGRLTANTDLALSAGALGNAQAGVIAANRDTTLNLASLANSGSIQAGRDLGLAASGSVLNSGSLTAQRNLGLQSASLSNDAGLIAANGALSIATGAASNQGGSVQAAGGLGVSASSLDNRSGQIVGAGNTTLAVGSGNLNNDSGIIASAQALGLTAGNTSNRLGQIVGGSGLVATTQVLDNSTGVIGSQAALTLNSQAFTNTGGTLQALGDLSLNAAAVSNTGGGRILANQAATLVATSIDNTGSTISAGTQLGINASGALTNGGGRITVGSNATVLAASLSNNAQGLISAAESLSLDTGTGALNNAGGTLVAGTSVQLASGALDNSAGTIASTQGVLAINTRGQGLTNDGGSLQAFGNTTLASGALSNRAGLVSGQNLSLGSTSLDNDTGLIVAKGALSVDAQSINNRAGLMQAAAALSINTHGGDLVNTDSGSYAGISAGGTLTISAAKLDNRAGVIASNGDQTLVLSGDLDNRGGLVSSSGKLGITAANTLVDNRSGRIVANGDLTLAAASLNNSGAGSSIAATNIGITAGSVDNSAGGSISAQNNASITATSLDNTGGSLSAKGQLSVSATQLANTNGQIVGDGGVSVSTASSAPGGSIASANNVALSIAGDYTNTGLLSARNSLSINAANIGNTGTLHADQALSLSTGNLANSGEISAQSTTITASGTLTNSGLIDGTSTRVSAGTLNNTGRLYGDALAVGGGTINNSGSGAIAARDSLSLGATTLNNTGGGLIYAINDIAIGGSLDAQGQLQGAMQTLLNASSTIEAGRDLSVNAGTLTNRNDGLTTTQVSQPTTALPVMLQPNGWTERYPLSRFIGVGSDTVQFIVHPEVYSQRSTVLPITTDVPQTCSGGDSEFCVPAYTIVNYAWNSPAFARFGVTPMSSPPPSEPAGGCTVTTSSDSGDSTSDVNSPACNQWRADTASWNSAFNATLSALGVQIDAYNASVNDDNSTIAFEDYTLYNLSSTSSSTQVLSSAPAKLLSGRDMTLTGAVVNNFDSQIVAGRNLFVSGASVNNVATTGTTTTTVSGTAQFSHLDSCGTFGDSHCRNTDGPVAYNPAPETTHPDLPTVVYLSNAANPTGTQSLTGSSASADARSAGNAASASGSVAQNGQSINTATGGTQSAQQSGQSSSGAGTGSGVQGSAAGTQAVAAHTANIGAVQSGSSSGANAGTPQAEQAGTGATSANPGRVSIGTVIHAGSRIDAVQVGSAASAGSANVATITAIAAPAAAAARLAPPTVQRVSAQGSGERARDVILTVVPRLSLPTSSLFTIHAEPGARYLVETDPRFTNGQTFLSSDYFLAQLKLDPERTLTRYGDGFEEQQLINDQVLTLTGRRYLSGYTNTQDEYAALMNAGVAFAKQYNLAPGVALSAELMASLTTDIVWLTTQTVTLADGSTRQVLVPELYIRRPQAQDLSTSGALMAGSNVFIQTTGDLANRGTIQGDTVTLAAGNDLVNSGTVRGQDVYARAERDLSNLGGSFIGSGDTSTLAFSAGRDIVLQTTTQTSSNADGSSTRTSVDRIATVQGGNVSFATARDFIAQGASVNAAQDLQVAAGRNIDVSAVEGSYQIDVQNLNGRAGLQGRTGYIHEASTTQQQSSFTAGNNAVLVAQGDVSFKGSTLTAANDAYLQGANVSIEAAKTSSSIDIQTVQKRSYDRAAKTDETLVGGVVTAGNNLTLNATAGNLTATGATLTATAGQAALIASGDVTIQAAIMQHSTLKESAYQYSGGISGVYAKSEQSQSAHSTQSTQVQSSNVSGNSVVIQAGDLAQKTGDIKLLASNVSSTGATSLSAGRDVIVDTVDQTASRSDFDASSSSLSWGSQRLNAIVADASNKSWAVLDPINGKKQPPPASGVGAASNSQGTSSVTQAIGSSISADSLNVSSGRDTLIRGSAVVTTGDLGIDAGRNLEILTSRNTQSGQDSRDKTDSGLFNSGASLTNGIRTQTAASQQSGDTASGSQVASLSGNVSLKAGEAYRQSGSQVLALGQGGTGGDVTIAAKQVDITNAASTQAGSEQQGFSQSGVTVAISNPLITALQTGMQMAQAAENTQGDARLQALAAATAVIAAAQAASSIADGSAASIGINVSFGESKSSSHSTQAASTAVGSTATAARDLRITATGGDLNATGSSLEAGRNASLQASGSINLQASQSTAEQHGVNDSSSYAVGVGFNVGSQNGFTINASGSKGLGHSDGTDLVYTNTTVKAGGTASLSSGGDTNLKGATVQANQVTAAVGGNLNIESLQDRSIFDAKQTSAGVAVSLCIPPICYGTSSVSGSYANAKAVGDFASVAEQSGIKAGDGGFQVQVAGNTDLKGGVVSSSQAAIDANKNSFTTATLTASDIVNRDAHEATAISASATVSGTAGDQSSEAAKQDMANRGMNKDQIAAAGQAGKPAGSMGLGSDSGSASSVTKSGISAGAIAITDGAAQLDLTGHDSATTLASLNIGVTTDKDTTAALTKAWNGAQMMDKVQASAQITAAFGAAAAKAVGDFADYQQKKYTDAVNYALLSDKQERGETLSKDESAYMASLNKAGMTLDKALATANDPQAKAEADKWDEGGVYRVAAHIAVGGLGGGVAGAVSAGSSAALMPDIGKAIDQMDLPDPVKQAVGMAAAGAIGAVSSGSVVGAATAFNTDVNNRQLHPREINWISANAKRFAKEQDITEEEADKRLADQAFRQVQFGAAGTTDAAASAFLKQAGNQLLPGDPSVAGANVGYMFIATPDQKANATMYLNALVSDPKAVKFYQDNGIKQPTIGQIAQAATTDAQARGVIANQTALAAIAAGTLALAPAFSGIASEAAAFIKDPKTYCLANPAGCTVGVEAAICTAAGTACPPSSLVPVVKVPSGTANVAANAGATVAGKAVPGVASTVEQATTGIQWGKGIQGQGLPWEDYLAMQLPVGSRLPANFKTFDFYDPLAQTAISAKTLDTTTVAKIADPSQVYYSLKSNVDAAANFEAARLGDVSLTKDMITTRELLVAVPASTTAAQWDQISRAIQYGESQGIKVIVTPVKGPK